MSASSVSVRLASRHASFGAAVRFLSALAVEGELSLTCCSYGTGLAYVDLVVHPAIAAVWPAIASLAFEDVGYDGDAFVGGWVVGADNSRANALNALMDAVLVEPKPEVKEEDYVVSVYYDGESYNRLPEGVEGQEKWTEQQWKDYKAAGYPSGRTCD